MEASSIAANSRLMKEMHFHFRVRLTHLFSAVMFPSAHFCRWKQTLTMRTRREMKFASKSSRKRFLEGKLNARKHSKNPNMDSYNIPN